MEVSAQISDLEQIHNWKDEVNSARESLRFMRSQLENIAQYKTDDDTLAQVEHFQNQFIRQLEVADEMHHDLKQSAKKIANNGQPHILHDDRPVDDFKVLKDRMQTFRKLYNEFGEEFKAFKSFS
jgi:flagellar biosynthesis chaperone FliJ